MTVTWGFEDEDAPNPTERASCAAVGDLSPTGTSVVASEAAAATSAGGAA